MTPTERRVAIVIMVEHLRTSPLAPTSVKQGIEAMAEDLAELRLVLGELLGALRQPK